RGHVGDLGSGEGPVALHVQRDRRLDAAEGEVSRAVGDLGDWEGDRTRVALLGGLLDDRAAWKSEPQELRHLVEGLAGGVAKRLSDDGGDDFEVPARRQLGHDAAVGRVNRVLGRNHAGNDTAAVGENRGRRLVTRTLDAEDDHLAPGWTALPNLRRLRRR